MTTQAPVAELLALSEFVGALVGQLDDVQDELHAKASTGRSLTWAIKDMSLELQVFFETDAHGTVRVRTAGPNETGASKLHLNLGAITREMIFENAPQFEQGEDHRPIESLLRELTPEVTPPQVRRLRSMGIRTVGQFIGQLAQLKTISARTGIPLATLQRAKSLLQRPALTDQREERRSDGSRLLRLLGANLTGQSPPRVSLCGEPVDVLEARPDELVVRPAPHQREGRIEIVVDGERLEGWYRPEPAPNASAPWSADPWSGGRAR